MKVAKYPEYKRLVYPGLKTVPVGESMTEQHHAKSCDINNIVAKYIKTGLMSHMKSHEGTYGDVTAADFQDAQNLIAEQKSIFNDLPAAVRAKFDNDPAQYLDKVLTDEGVEELRQILAPNPEPVKEPEPAQKEPEKAPEGES